MIGSGRPPQPDILGVGGIGDSVGRKENMGETELQARVRERLGLRVGPEMAAYILKQLTDDGDASIPVIAADARTGVPLRKELSPATLRPLVAPGA
jgi:hypothetical protein